MIYRDTQARAANGPGNFILLACPGSGKTRTAAERIAAQKRLEGRRIALCSYTNIGVGNLIDSTTRRHGARLDSGDFSGTLHKFLLRFVVYPYAHLLGTNEAVRVVDRWRKIPVCGTNDQRVGLEKFCKQGDGSLTIHGELERVSVTKERVVTESGEAAWAEKERLFKSCGLVSADDAMWIALQVLRFHPELARAVGGRFHELLIDEAQDTSELQTECLWEIARAGGLHSLVLIGDFDQSICGFNGASPELVIDLSEALGLTQLSLNRNYRGSQVLCDVASNFRVGRTADQARGENRDLTLQPESFVYEWRDRVAAVRKFEARLEELGIKKCDSVVLTRSNMFLGANDRAKVKERAQDLLDLADAVSRGEVTARSLDGLGRQLSRVAFDDPYWGHGDPGRSEQLRDAILLALEKVPAPVGSVADWLRSARDGISVAVNQLTDSPSKSVNAQFPVKAEYETINCDGCLEDVEWPTRTVHDAKGEEFDAVLILLTRPEHPGVFRHPELWEHVVAGTPIPEELAEELRVAFVGVTRAKRYLGLAVPDSQRGKLVGERAASAGFVHIVPGD